MFFKKSRVLLATLSLSSVIAAPVMTFTNNIQQVHAMSASQEQFINTIKPYAIQMSNKYGVWTSIMMAQAIVESNWGTSTLGAAPNYNMFGMKANNGWTGRTVTKSTQEWENGHYITINAAFRSYNGYADSFDDNGRKLRYGIPSNANYYSGTWVDNTKTYQDEANFLQSRYATSPTYAQTLINAVQKYNLSQYDPVVQDITSKITILSPTTVYNTYADIRQGTGETLQPGDTGRVTRIVTLQGGSTWYKIGNNRWVYGGSNAKIENFNGKVDDSGVVQIKYVPGYSIAVWNQATDGRWFTGQKLKDGTQWKFFSKYYIDGHVWYQVGGNQWIDGSYATEV